MKRSLMAFAMASTLLLTTGCGTGAKDKEIPPEDLRTITGTLDEIKDFMLVVIDEEGTSYGFDFDHVPDGLEDVQEGDLVTVTYTGLINEVNPLVGGSVISVEAAEAE